MILYPTMELQHGRCVSLNRGRLEEPHIWHVDPVETAQGFAAAGAEWMHLTDLDAVAGDTGNGDLTQDILRHAGLSVQLGGGFRSLEQIEHWIDLGAGRIVIGTLALIAPEVVKEAAKHYPDQIVLAVDVFQGRVMSDGWRTPSAFDPADFIAQFDADPLAAILITDIDADLGDAEDSLALIERIAGLARVPVIARGLARSMDDLARIKYVPHLAGALVGPALFSRDIDLTEALTLAAEVPERAAEFV